MDIGQQILHFYRVEELSLWEISRKTGADHKTVTRLINAFEAAIKENPETGIDEPKYKSRAYKAKVVKDAFHAAFPTQHHPLLQPKVRCTRGSGTRTLKHAELKFGNLK